MNLEQIEQIKLFNWIKCDKNLEPYCFHIANERRTSIQHGYILKRMGIKKGVSDIFIGIPRAHYHGMFLELKEGNNKPTDNQLQFMDNMSLQGYYCVWSKGYENARKAIEEYLNKSKHANKNLSADSSLLGKVKFES